MQLLKNNRIIAIDGPSASGKGSLAKALAEELNFILLDSGLLYRAYSYCFNLSHDHQGASELFRLLQITSSSGAMKILDKDLDITNSLRSEKVAKSASILSIQKETRENLITFQRHLVNKQGLVADGRDMGTVVFPHAATKIFLVADVEVRAKRRFLELQNTDQGVNMRDLIEDIRLRDEADRTRELSPLIPAADSVEVNSSFLTPHEVLTKVLEIYKNKTS